MQDEISIVTCTFTPIASTLGAESTPALRASSHVEDLCAAGMARCSLALHLSVGALTWTVSHKETHSLD